MEEWIAGGVRRWRHARCRRSRTLEGTGTGRHRHRHRQAQAQAQARARRASTQQTRTRCTAGAVNHGEPRCCTCSCRPNGRGLADSLGGASEMHSRGASRLTGAYRTASRPDFLFVCCLPMQLFFRVTSYIFTKLGRTQLDCQVSQYRSVVQQAQHRNHPRPSWFCDSTPWASGMLACRMHSTMAHV